MRAGAFFFYFPAPTNNLQINRFVFCSGDVVSVIHGFRPVIKLHDNNEKQKKEGNHSLVTWVQNTGSHIVSYQAGCDDLETVNSI